MLSTVASGLTNLIHDRCSVKQTRLDGRMCLLKREQGTGVSYVIVRPLSTVVYTSVAASVIHSRRGLTNLIHDRCGVK